MSTTGQPLPQNFTHPLISIVSAHNKCLEVESKLSEALTSDLPASTKGVLKMQLMYLRILGHLLTHAPSESGKAYMAQSIFGCGTDEKLFEMGRFYQKHLICACKLSYICNFPY